MADTSTDTEELSNLFAHLTLQSRTLLAELTQFQHYITAHSLLSSSSTPLLTKLLSDVRHEHDLLAHHGATLNLTSPPSPHPPPPPPPPTTADTNTDPQDLSSAPTPNRRSQARMLKSTATSSPVHSTHRIRSSNINFLSAVWAEMKRSRGIIAARKPVRYLPDAQPLGPVGSKGSRGARDREERQQQPQDSLNRQNMGGTTSLAKVPRRVKGADGVVRRANKEPVTVDIVAEHGRRWIKIVTKSPGSLLMDLAREGLVDFGESEDDEDEEEGEAQRKGGNESGDRDEGDLDIGHQEECGRRGRDGEGSATGEEQMTTSNSLGNGSTANGSWKLSNGNADVLAELKLVKTAKDFLAAAKTARVGLKHEHPQVHFHLTKIERGRSRDVDAVIACLEGIGVIVSSADQMTARDRDINMGEQVKLCQIDHMEDTFERMLAAPPPLIPTSILNIDCTTLIALISDISHSHRSDIKIPTHYHGRQAGKDIEVQLATEPEDALLPHHIYPLLRSKRLVCTSKAASHLRNIVRIMGSATETKRSNIFLPIGPEDRREGSGPACDLRRFSVHNVPEDLQLPIEIIDDTVVTDGFRELCTSTEEEVRKRLSQHPRLSPLNRSVFFHGWKENITTISLNRDVSEWLGRAIDATLDDIEAEDATTDGTAIEENFEGPKVLICGRERSLLGSEK